MSVLAIMQNQWVRDPAQLHRILERHDEDFRRRMIAKLLFRGCVSGRRIKAAFGDLCEQITWEESSRVITGKPNECPPADPEHIAGCLETLRPDIVITFGVVALEGLIHARGILRDGYHLKVIAAPHPAARQAYVPTELTRAANDLRVLLAARQKEEK